MYGNRVSPYMRLKFSDIITGGVWEPRVPLHEFDFVIDLQEPCVSLHMNDALSKKQLIDRRCMGTACPPSCKIKDNMYQYRRWWGTARPPQVGYIFFESNLRTPQYFAARAWSMTCLHLMYYIYKKRKTGSGVPNDNPINTHWHLLSHKLIWEPGS